MTGNAARRDWQATLPSNGGDWKYCAEYNEISRWSLTAHLQAVRCRGPLAASEIGAICVVRNEAVRLPIFFDHYKRLGVSRFFMVDNCSDDATRDLLLSEPSADVFIAHAGFAESYGGLYWANGLAREYCRNNWALRPDADELLVYDGMENHGLTDLADWLAAHGRDRLFVMVVDVYPSTTLGIEQRSIAGILATDCWFDSEGYDLERRQGGWVVTGGPRRRLFEYEYHHWLSKYSFFRVTDATALVDHWIWPLDLSQEQPLGAILHLKLMDDFIERSRRFESEGQHASGALAYKMTNEKVAEMPDVNFFHAHSRRYRGPKSLIRYRMMQPIDWRN